MDKKQEIRLIAIGIILVALIFVVIWAVQNKKLSFFAASSQPASLSLSPSIGTYTVGEKVGVDIIIDAQDIKASGVEVEISYDPEVIEIIDQDETTEGIQIKTSDLFSTYWENSVDPENGTIKMSAMNQGKEEAVFINSPVSLASISFISKKAVSTSLVFDFQKGETSDSNIFAYFGNIEKDVLLGILNGTYNFQ